LGGFFAVSTDFGGKILSTGKFCLTGKACPAELSFRLDQIMTIQKHDQRPQVSPAKTPGTK
jgi:hypothetical protein